MACIPALAYLASLALNRLLPEMGKPFAQLPPELQQWIQTVMIVAGGGTFIVTSLLWSTALAHLIDGRIRPTAATLLLAAVFSWFGIIHSPLPSSPIMAPAEVMHQLEAEGRAKATARQTPYHWSAAYLLTAVMLLALGRFGKAPSGDPVDPLKAE